MRLPVPVLTACVAWGAEPPALLFAVERVVLAQELRLGADGGRELGLLVLVLRARTPSGVTMLGYGPATVDLARSDAGDDCAPAPPVRNRVVACAWRVGRKPMAILRSSCV